MKRNPRRAIAALSLFFVMAATSPAHAADRSLSFAVPGIIAQINVKPGMNVGKGTVLAVLDQGTLSARKKAGEARVTFLTLKSDLMARRLEQTRQLYDSLSASTENVENAEVAAAAATSELADAVAKSAFANSNLRNATLRAPSAGTIIRIPGYAGMVIPANGDVVSVIILRTP